MVPAQDTGNLLETIERGENEVPKLKSVKVGRVAGTSDSQQPKRLLEDNQNIGGCTTNKIIARLGYISMPDYYLKVS